jgi:hypothetical protein
VSLSKSTVALAPASSLSRILTWAKRLFTPVALVFLIYVGWQSRALLATVVATAQWNFLLMAILFLILPHFVSAGATVMILKACGISVSYRFALQTHINRLPARYLPGGVWHSVGRMMDFHTYGVKPSQLTAFFLLENILAIAVAFLLGGLCLWYFRGLAEDRWGQLAAIAVIGNLLGLALTPMVISRYVLKIAHQWQLRFYLQAIGLYVPIWLLFASGFVCYFSAFPLALGNLSKLEVGGTYLFSWATGLVTFFAPQGLGIFEVVAGHLLNAPLSLGSLATLIAGFRVVSLVADITLWGLQKLLRFSENKNKARGKPRQGLEKESRNIR